MSKPLSILLAPDSFKGSLTATQFCQIAAQEITKQIPDAKIFQRPVSDGGEGFVESFTNAGLAERHSLWVSGPLGKKTKANFAWQAETATAIIEMAQASGITKVRRDDLNPLNTHSYGTGQVIQKALDLGAKRVILGLGGSATNDAGLGALMALGVPLLNEKKQEINLGGHALKDLSHIGEIPQHLLDIEWQIASDVTNPLLGEQGATQVFGPQKGGQPHQLELLENAMQNFTEVLQQHTSTPIHSIPGSGAAGGMAAGFMGLLNAKITPGFDVISDTLQLESLLQNEDIDYIFTGEGQFDEQTRFGKLPMRIAELGLKHNIPTIGFCGSLQCSVEELAEFHAIFSIVNGVMELDDAMRNTPLLLQQSLHSVIKLIK